MVSRPTDCKQFGSPSPTRSGRTPLSSYSSYRRRKVDNIYVRVSTLLKHHTPPGDSWCAGWLMRACGVCLRQRQTIRRVAGSRIMGEDGRTRDRDLGSLFVFSLLLFPNDTYGCANLRLPFNFYLYLFVFFLFPLQLGVGLGVMGFFFLKL